MEAPLDHGASGCSYAKCLVLILDWATQLMGRPIGSGRKALIFRRCLWSARTVNKETCAKVEKTHVFMLHKAILHATQGASHWCWAVDQGRWNGWYLGWPNDLLEETLCILKFIDKFRSPLGCRPWTWSCEYDFSYDDCGWLKDISVGKRDVIARQWTERLAHHRRCSSTWRIARSAIENRDGQWPENLLSAYRRSSSEPRIRDEATHQDPRPRRSRSHSLDRCRQA